MHSIVVGFVLPPSTFHFPVNYRTQSDRTQERPEPLIRSFHSITKTIKRGEHGKVSKQASIIKANETLSRFSRLVEWKQAITSNAFDFD